MTLITSFLYPHPYYSYTDKAISMKTLIIKSLLTSLYQREGNYPSLAKSVRLATERGEGRFFNNVVLLITALVSKGYSMEVQILYLSFITEFVVYRDKIYKKFS